MLSAVPCDSYNPGLYFIITHSLSKFSKSHFFCRKSIRGIHPYRNFCYPTPNSSPNRGAKLGVIFFSTKLTLFVGNQYGEPIPIGISAVKHLIPPPQCVEKWILSPGYFFLEKMTDDIVLALNRNA